ncbi:MAG: c-type cytochrome [Methylophilaceae bacterium]|nr:c-type cytochrome [Methylophilaceae bacterium]
MNNQRMALPYAGMMFLTLSLISGCTQESSSPQAEQMVTQAIPVNLQPKLGEQIYQQVCMACHDTGVMEAPKFGDAAAWAELIEEGYGVLVYESIKGEGNMPPRGGNPALTDMEVAHAVAYLANAAGADFVPPESEEALQALLSAAKIEVEQTHDGHEE